MQLTFATRPSTLARWQTARVIQLLQAAHPGLEYSEYVMLTTGDHVPDNPFPKMRGKELIAIQLSEALFSGKAQAVVHSLKDLPLEDTPGIVVAAIPERELPYDVLVSADGQTLSNLREGARVGTSSLRRTVQLLARRPDLNILPLRGEIDTRLQKVMDHEYDAIVLAQAGLTRLGWQSHVSEVFPLDVMLPAPGQGALAVRCRADDTATIKLLSAIHDPVASAAVDAERAFLAGLNGKCSLPVGAFAEIDHGIIILTGAVISTDGKQAIRLSAADREPRALGQRLADLVLERGTAEMLKVSV